MKLDAAICYRAIRTQDRRFDGRFFTAVRTTGVYCRPICPPPKPKPDNCTFMPSAAAAQRAGYRPCLRCRPEAAPGPPPSAGIPEAVSRAVCLIAAGALDHGTFADLAGRIGLGEAALRQLFHRHLGAPPQAVAETGRLLFAKQLLRETGLPAAAIAEAAGLASVRRLNQVMGRTFGRPADSLRGRAVNRPGGPLTLRFGYRPPYPWPLMLRFLARRAIDGLETVDGAVYRRTIALGATTGRIAVRTDQTRNDLVVDLHLSDTAALEPIAGRLRHQFDLAAAPADIGAGFAADPTLGPLVGACPGVRVPGGWSVWEIAVRAVLGQSISVAAATGCLRRMVAQLGRPLAAGLAGDGLSHLFPTPAAIAESDLDGFGLTGAKRAALGALAHAARERSGAFDPASSWQAARAALLALPGIGPWTADYIALRGLGDRDAFPAADLGLLRAAGTDSARALEHRAEAWRPWRAYAALYLWLANDIHAAEAA